MYLVCPKNSPIQTALQRTITKISMRQNNYFHNKQNINESESLF